MKVEDCTRCPLHKLMPSDCKPIPGHGNTKADIMFVSDFVTSQDTKYNQLISGRVEKYFHKLLDKAGINKENIYMSSILHCRPLNNNKERRPKKSEIDSCKVWVWQDMKEVSPKAVVSLGLIPTNTLGRPLFNKNVKLNEVIGERYKLPYIDAYLFPCQHPRTVITRGKTMEEKLVQTLIKVREFCDSSLSG